MAGIKNTAFGKSKDKFAPVPPGNTLAPSGKPLDGPGIKGAPVAKPLGGASPVRKGGFKTRKG
ncbi:MAG: hypothetical protein ACK54T_07295 [bacterium]